MALVLIWSFGISSIVLYLLNATCIFDSFPFEYTYYLIYDHVRVKFYFILMALVLILSFGISGLVLLYLLYATCICDFFPTFEYTYYLIWSCSFSYIVDWNLKCKSSQFGLDSPREHVKGTSSLWLKDISNRQRKITAWNHLNLLLRSEDWRGKIFQMGSLKMLEKRNLLQIF